MKKLDIPCNFGGGTSVVSIFIGTPNESQHPIKFQSNWLSSEKGGTVPKNIMDSLEKIHKLAKENNVSFEDLCYYAITVANKTVVEENPEFNKVLLKLGDNSNLS